MKPNPLLRIGLILVLGWASGLARADEAAKTPAPLRLQVDQLVSAANNGRTSPICSDSEFLRRVYLDLTGDVPSPAETRAFLTDDSADKRTALVDRLLASPQYAQHMATVFDIMLMERRADKHVKTDEWRNYLAESFAANKPWNALAREILTADGSDEQLRPAVRFYLGREGEPNLITRDIGRMFFGMDLQCCQCHDHPLVTEYYQSDYFGIYAFLNRGFLFTDKDKKVFYAEKAEGDAAKFTSVFTEEQSSTRPKLPGGAELLEPVFLKGDEYTVKPAKGVRPVPKFSRRSLLAHATDGGNTAFNRNIVNRLWSHMFGRGLVEPVDLDHPDNPAAHPLLLSRLAEEFVGHEFDIKWLLRELALSETYQRSLELPAAPQKTALTPDQLQTLKAQMDDRKQALSEVSRELEAIEKEIAKSEEAAAKVLAEFNAANEGVGKAHKALEDLNKKMTAAKQKLQSKQDLHKTVDTAAVQAKAAAEKLPKEKELADAAAVFVKRAEALAGETASAKKAVDDLMPQITKATDEHGQARNAASKIVASLEEANSSVTRQQDAWLQKSREQLQAATKLQSIRAQIGYSEQLIQIGEIEQQIVETRTQFKQTEELLAASRVRMNEGSAAMPSLREALNTAQEEFNQAKQKNEASQAELARRQEAAQLVAAAAQSAKQALGKLPKDAELKSAAESIEKRSAQLNSELEPVKKAAMEQQAAFVAAEKRFAEARSAADKMQKQLQEATAMIPKLESQLPELEKQLEAQTVKREQTHSEAMTNWSNSFFTARLRPLSPEQMAVAVMKVTGYIDRQQAAAKAEVDKKLPIDPKKPDDAARIAEREKALEKYVFDKMKANIGTFVKLFGHAAGQPQADFFATVDQALYFANAGTVQSWLNPGGGNLTDRLNKLQEPAQVAEELYVSVLAREPTEEETQDVAEYLEGRTDDRVSALKEMAWALITSAEFRFSY